MSAPTSPAQERRTGSKWKRAMFRVRQHIAVWWVTGMFVIAACVKAGVIG